MKDLQTTGIILRSRDMGEADRLLTIFSFDQGKLLATARGSRRVKSKLAGHLEPLAFTDLRLTEGRTFYVVCGAELRYPYQLIRADLAKTSLAIYFLEAVDHLTVEHQPHPVVFELLKDVLSIMETATLKQRGNLRPAFLLRLLHELGYLPELQDCVRCGGSLAEEGTVFSFSNGGLLDEICAGSDPQAVKVSSDLIKTLRFAVSQPLQTSCRIALDNKTAVQFQRLVEDFFEYQTERQLKSSALIVTLAD